ncbi:MAG: aminopeptidase P family protein [bacterium]
MTKMQQPFLRRLTALRRGMKESGTDAMFVVDRYNTQYLSGFRGTHSTIFISHDLTYFMTDSRYFERVGKELSGWELELQAGNGREQLKELVKRRRWKTIGFEGSLPHSSYQTYSGLFEGAKMEEKGSLIKDLRITKGSEEKRALLKAVKMGDKVFARLLEVLEFSKVGPTEWELRNQIRRIMDDLGAEGESFPTIVAAGANSSLPHATPGDREVHNGDFLLFDFGVLLDGYCSDMTRTILWGKPSGDQRKVYDAVLAAQTRALDALEPGVKARDVDAIARDTIDKKGFGEYFGHGLGHGVGLEIHEPPTLNPQSEDVLEAGMVVTVEPGIYIPGFGGVRIEDMAVITEDGCEILTQTPKRLLCVG